MYRQTLHIHRSDADRRARMGQADVDRAMEVLGVKVSAEEARLSGGVRELRCKLDALLDELLPPASRPGLGQRLLRWAGLGARARAADAGVAALFDGLLPTPGCIGLSFLKDARASGGCSSPEQAMRGFVADALDDAYCVMLPHEAARRAELHRAFWASAREKDRKREFVTRCLGHLE